MAALVANGAYPDLYMGTNLDRVPTEQFAGPWWYRTEFELGEREASGTARLVFEGINYRANVWLNGARLASADEIVGAFRVHELDLAGRAQPGVNALAVEVLPPQPGDFTIGFVDWNPRPPDRNMGLWRPVVLRLTGRRVAGRRLRRARTSTSTRWPRPSSRSRCWWRTTAANRSQRSSTARSRERASNASSPSRRARLRP